MINPKGELHLNNTKETDGASKGSMDLLSRRILHLSHRSAVIFGVVTGVVGMIVVLLAYPVYEKTVKTQKERISPQIISLTDELLK
ncbi:MAG: hypothetical protein E7575_00605 [Ruminococcaceae bacterium]|nr:hypothetical protein [Oscillospiraceae bacterium]